MSEPEGDRLPSGVVVMETRCQRKRGCSLALLPYSGDSFIEAIFLESGYFRRA